MSAQKTILKAIGKQSRTTRSVEQLRFVEPGNSSSFTAQEVRSRKCQRCHAARRIPKMRTQQPASSAQHEHGAKHIGEALGHDLQGPVFFSLFTKVGVLHSRFAHVPARALVGGPGFPPTDTEGPHSRCAVRALMPTSGSIPLHVCPRQGAGLSLHARTSNGTQSSLWLLSSSTCGRAIFSHVRNIDPKNGDNLSSARQKMFYMRLRSLIFPSTETSGAVVFSSKTGRKKGLPMFSDSLQKKLSDCCFAWRPKCWRLEG